MCLLGNTSNTALVSIMSRSLHGTCCIWTSTLICSKYTSLTLRTLVSSRAQVPLRHKLSLLNIQGKSTSIYILPTSRYSWQYSEIISESMSRSVRMSATQSTTTQLPVCHRDSNCITKFVLVETCTGCFWNTLHKFGHMFCAQTQLKIPSSTRVNKVRHGVIVHFILAENG